MKSIKRLLCNSDEYYYDNFPENVYTNKNNEIHPSINGQVYYDLCAKIESLPTGNPNGTLLGIIYTDLKEKI